MQTVVANTRSDTLYTKNGIPVLFYKIETPSFSSNCSQQAVEKINAFYEALAKDQEHSYMQINRRKKKHIAERNCIRRHRRMHSISGIMNRHFKGMNI